MSPYKSDLLHTLHERGYIHQCSAPETLDGLARTSTVTGYSGFDCTAKSLHVGNLVQIMMLRHMQRTGHKPVVLIGGATTRVGDPSFRDESRPLLSDREIDENKAGIRQAFDKFLTFGDGANDAMLVDNRNWLDGLNYIDFLRDYGRHFSVNRMLSFDSVKLRLEREQPLTFLEFNYMILQAYDFLELYRKLGCRLQLGGSDQWGNIVNGIELGRRLEGVELFGLTTPLLTTASGQKMGKTAAGAVWLNADMHSPYDYWQFWRNTEDADVGRFMRLFTELPLDEIARYERLEGQELNGAKKVLATEATALAHGRTAAENAAEAARQTFEEGGAGEGLPTAEIPAAELERGVAVFTLFSRAGLCASNGEARRLIKGGGARLNDQIIEDEMQKVTSAALRPDGVLKLSAGKKRHALIKPA